MTEREQLCEFIEQLNREHFEITSCKQMSYGQKIVNIVGAIKQHKILNLLSSWHKTYKIKKTFDLKTPSNYNYGDYPSRDIKFCVYTCVTGGYDHLQPIHVIPENVDFVAFTDDLSIDANGWNLRPLPAEVVDSLSNADKNRYLKMHPSLVGDKYDYAIYVDGLVEIMSDLTNMINVINRQWGIGIHNHFFRNCIFKEVEFCHYNNYGDYGKMRSLISLYADEGFPKNYGLLECTVIISDLHNDWAIKILNQWWKEHVRVNIGRDQITLPYILWKNNIALSEIGTLGNNVKSNPKFRINGHKVNKAKNNFELK